MFDTDVILSSHVVTETHIRCCAPTPLREGVRASMRARYPGVCLSLTDSRLERAVPCDGNTA